MKNYIIWNTAEHKDEHGNPQKPDKEQEKYIVFENNNYYLWDSYTWQQVPIESGKIASEAISEDIARTQEVSEVKEYLSTHRFGTRTIVIFLEFYNTNIKPSGPPVGGRYDKTSESLSEHYPIRCPLSNGSLSDTWTDKWNGILPKVEDDPSVIYYSFGTFNIDTEMQIGDWTFPMPMLIGRDGTDGNDGKDGADGVSMEFIYKRVRNLDEFYALEAPASDHYTPRYVPPYWNGAPIGVTIDETVEAVCSRSLNPDTGLWGDYSNPTIFAMYSKDGESYRGFTIYAGFEDASHIPTKPTTGRWDPETDTVYFDDPGNEGWSVDVPSEELNIWKTSATFNAIGEKIEGWTPPVRYNAIIVKVNEYNRYYMASTESSGIKAPDKHINPETEGWTINGDETELCADIPYLWSFERYIYSDGNIYQTEPVILRYFNAEAQVTFDQVQQFIIGEINNELEDSEKRLGQISETESTITSQGGLTKILNSYNDENHKKAFADIVANAAEATIKLKAASEIGDELTTAGTTLNGISGNVTTVVGKLNGIPDEPGSVQGAIHDVGVEAITSAVTKGQYCWIALQDAIISGQNVVKNNSYPYGSTEDGVTKRNNDENFEDYETRILAITSGENPVFEKKLISQEMSTIKQESGKISLLVGTDGQLKTGIQIIANSVPDGGSKIELDATKIILNGNVVANAIQANGIAVGTGTGSSFVANTSISTDGILKTLKAHIEGNLYSQEGFFGIYGYEPDGKTPKPINGVHIGGYGDGGGLYSTNFYTEDSQLARKGFGLFGSEYYFFGEDGSYITKDTIVTRKVSASKNGFITAIDENGFTIKKNDEVLAEFIVDPDNNNYIRLRIKGPDGWCDITGSGQNVHTNTETVIIEPKWTEVRYGMLRDVEELYYDFELGHTWADHNIGAPQFEVPTINTYYLYSCGYKITTVTESESTTRKTTYLNPSTGQYQDTRPEQDGKYYVYKNFSEEAQLGKYTIFSYPSGFNTILISDYPGHYYYVYDFEFQESDGSIHFVRAQKLHSAASDSGTLKGGEELEITYRTDVEDYGK